MHSSRMRTARFLPYREWGLCPGLGLCPEESLSGTPPPLDRMTDMCKTLPCPNYICGRQIYYSMFLVRIRSAKIRTSYICNVRQVHCRSDLSCTCFLRNLWNKNIAGVHLPLMIFYHEYDLEFDLKVTYTSYVIAVLFLPQNSCPGRLS